MAANPGGLIYGTIAVAALLAAESAKRETYAETVGAVALTLLLYWVARSYAEFAGRRLQESEPFKFPGLVRAMAHEASVLLGAALPLLVLLILWLAGAHLTAAVTAAVWTSAVTILAIEVFQGIRSRLSGPELAVPIVFGGVVGLLVLALRVVLH